MSYITIADLTNKIDSINLQSMFDDFAQGTLNSTILNNILQLASDTADSLVSSIYKVPFATPPGKIKIAALAFACEMCYARRLTPIEENPFRNEAEYWRKQLMMVNSGELSLDESFNRGFVPVAFNISINRVDTNMY